MSRDLKRYFGGVPGHRFAELSRWIKSASQGISVGCGIRVLSGEKTGYAYRDGVRV